MIKVAFVIDESGSMGADTNGVISLVNEQFDEIRNQDAKVYLYTFNSEVKKIVEQNSKKLDKFTDYKPNGCTALFDAVGKAINDLSENDRYDDKYLIIVISDGMENASKEFNRSRISDLITKCQKTERWTFTYLGGTHDLTKFAENFFQTNHSNTKVFEGFDKDAVLMKSALKRSFVSYASGVNNITNFYQES